MSGQPDPVPVQGLTDAGGRPLLPPTGYVPANPSRYHQISAAQVGIDGIDRTADQGEGNYEVPADHALVIQPGGEDDLLAYAMYALTDLDTERPVKTEFSVNAAPIQPGGEEDLPLCFWVGISDFTTYAWEWHGPYSSPDNAVNVDLNDLLGGVDIRDRYISAANVLYMVVLTEAGAEFVGPGNPLGLTAARIDLLTIDKLTVGELGYRSTRPHFPLIESIGVGGAAAASGAKQAAALDPSQYVTLTWTHVFDPADPDAEALQYKVYRKGPDGEFLPIGTVLSPEQEYTDPTDNASWVPEVQPGAKYTYYMRAYNDAGFTPFSSQEYVIPLLGPTDLQATDGAFMDKIALTWTKAEGATGYKVYRDGQAETDLIATLGDVATYDDTGVTDFDPHTYWVRGTTLDLPDGGLFSASDNGYRSSGAPYADLSANPLSGAAPLTVDFDASASHDPDDGVDPGQGIVKYEWDWEGDGTYDSDSGADPTVSHIYNVDGTFNATVRVTDNESDTATAVTPIQVGSASAPVINLVTPLAGGVGEVTTFSASVDGTPPLTYAWDFGGGAAPNISSDESPVVTLGAEGIYDASLTVTNIIGGDTFNFTVTISGGVPSELPSEWNTALSNVGITSSNLGMQPIFDPTDANLLTPDSFAWQAPYTDIRTILPLYWKQWYYGKDTVKMPETINTKRDELRVTDSIQDLLLSAIAEFQADQQSAAQNANDTLAGSDPLANAIADFVTAVGGTPNLSMYIEALTTMSDANQRALARVVKGCEKAWVDRHASLYDVLGYDDTTLQTHFDGTHPFWLPSPNKPAGYAPVYMVDDDGAGPDWYFMRSYPYHDAFFPEACYIADAIDQLTAFVKTNPVWEDVILDVDTPAGKVVIGATGNDTYDAALPDGYAILIDLGGTDTYNCHAGGTASAKNGIAVTIDLAGDDWYNAMDDPLDVRNPPNDETCQQGSARYGVGMLVDYAGNDHYQCVRMGQGAAVMGVGALADFAGDDSYDAEALVQGAAYGGVGLLYDKDGSDSYTAWSLGQGFGGIMGVGFLIDQSNGSDVYTAVPDYSAQRPEYQSAQDAAYNNNFCQGAAFGKRWSADAVADPIVGAGGLGLLYDGGGDDDYECGIFGQAVGFFHSLGVLIDEDGTDVYHGIWYVQGATAHVACAFLWEGGGNDSYWSRSSIAVGGAHDWSVTWFMERGGDDTYNGSGLSLGTGYNSGQGFFIDMDGADHYLTDNCDGTSETLGRGGWPATGRETETSIGIFVDAGGADTYSAEYAGMLDGSAPALLVATPPADGASWVRINGDSGDAGLAGMGFYEFGIGSGIDSGS